MIEGGGSNREYTDFLLMRDVWHCTPSEFEEQSEYNISLHKSILNMEAEYQRKEERRAEQRAKLHNK